MFKKIVFFCIVILLTSCEPHAPKATITPSADLTYTFQPSPSLTLTQTASSIRTTSPSWTPLPTLAPEQVSEIAAEWITTNRGCKYPCLWGIIPGETDWVTVKSMLDQMSPFYSDPRPLESIGEISQSVSYPLPDNWAYSSEGFITFVLNNNVIQSMEALSDLSLAQFLTLYGLPNEVWIQYSNILRYTDYSISLYYADQGIIALFIDEWIDNQLICPYRFSETLQLLDGYNNLHVIDHRIHPVILWAPTQQTSYQEIMNIYFPSEQGFLPLADITNMNLQEFYEIYQNPSTFQCMEPNVEH